MVGEQVIGADSFASRWWKSRVVGEPGAADVALLSRFLRVCDGDVRAAAARADRYYRARTVDGSNLFRERRPESDDILTSCQEVYLVCPRTRSVGGRRLTIARLPAPAALDAPLDAPALLRRWLMMLDLRLREEAEDFTDEADAGEVMVVDVRDLPPKNLARLFRGNHWRNFVTFLKAMNIAYPLRLEEVHVVNTSALRLAPLALACAGLAPWRRRATRVHAHCPPINQLLARDHFPRHALPHEYGGTAGTLEELNEEWTSKLLSNARWFESEEARMRTLVLRVPGSEKRPAAAWSRAPVRLATAALAGSARTSYTLHGDQRGAGAAVCDDFEYDELQSEGHGRYRAFRVEDQNVY